LESDRDARIIRASRVSRALNLGSLALSFAVANIDGGRRIDDEKRVAMSKERRRKNEYTRMPAARSLRSYRARGFDDLLTTARDKVKANELRGSHQ